MDAENQRTPRGGPIPKKAAPSRPYLNDPNIEETLILGDTINISKRFDFMPKLSPKVLPKLNDDSVGSLDECSFMEEIRTEEKSYDRSNLSNLDLSLPRQTVKRALDLNNSTLSPLAANESKQSIAACNVSQTSLKPTENESPMQKPVLSRPYQNDLCDESTRIDFTAFAQQTLPKLDEQASPKQEDKGLENLDERTFIEEIRAEITSNLQDNVENHDQLSPHREMSLNLNGFALSPFVEKSPKPSESVKTIREADEITILEAGALLESGKSKPNEQNKTSVQNLSITQHKSEMSFNGNSFALSPLAEKSTVNVPLVREFEEITILEAGALMENVEPEFSEQGKINIENPLLSNQLIKMSSNSFSFSPLAGNTSKSTVSASLVRDVTILEKPGASFDEQSCNTTLPQREMSLNLNSFALSPLVKKSPKPSESAENTLVCEVEETEIQMESGKVDSSLTKTDETFNEQNKPSTQNSMSSKRDVEMSVDLTENDFLEPTLVKTAFDRTVALDPNATLSDIVEISSLVREVLEAEIPVEAEKIDNFTEKLAGLDFLLAEYAVSVLNRQTPRVKMSEIAENTSDCVRGLISLVKDFNKAKFGDINQKDRADFEYALNIERAKAKTALQERSMLIARISELEEEEKQANFANTELEERLKRL